MDESRAKFPKSAKNCIKRQEIAKNVKNMDENVKSVSDYRKLIVKALKKAGTYSAGVDMQILNLATALRTLDLANQQIDGLDEVTVWEQTRYGKKLAPHPVFKVQKDAQDSITRQMKILGLTTELLAGTDETDPLVELTKKVVRTGKKKTVVIKPDDTDK